MPIFHFSLSITLLASVLSPAFTSAAQYSTECTVQANGKEVCKERRIEEKQFVPVPELSSSSSSRPEEIPFELGGLMVTQKNNFCVDESDSCIELIGSKDNKWCASNMAIRDVCRLSCGACDKTAQESKSPLKKTTIGVPQNSNGSEAEKQATDEVLVEMVRYLREEVLVEVGYQNMYRKCINTNELCAFWASVGECKNNPGYMGGDCMLACKKCNEHEDYMY